MVNQDGRTDRKMAYFLSSCAMESLLSCSPRVKSTQRKCGWRSRWRTWIGLDPEGRDL